MKKIIRIMIIGICLMFSNVYASGVEITDIQLDSKSSDSIINKEITFNGLETNLSAKFFKEGDFIKYKVTIKNKDNEDYKVIDEPNWNKSDYIEYSYDTNKTIKANSTTTIDFIIKYKKEVDERKLKDYKYLENNLASIEFVNLNENIINPNTSKNFSILITLLIIVLIVSILFVLIKCNKKGLMIPVFIFFTGIPFIVNATKGIVLKVNTNIELSYFNDTFCMETKIYEDYSSKTDLKVNVPYRKGMNWKDFIDFNIKNPTLLDGFEYKENIGYDNYGCTKHLGLNYKKTRLNTISSSEYNDFGLDYYINNYNGEKVDETWCNSQDEDTWEKYYSTPNRFELNELKEDISDYENDEEDKIYSSNIGCYFYEAE